MAKILVAEKDKKRLAELANCIRGLDLELEVVATPNGEETRKILGEGPESVSLAVISQMLDQSLLAAIMAKHQGVPYIVLASEREGSAEFNESAAKFKQYNGDYIPGGDDEALKQKVLSLYESALKQGGN